MNVRSVISHAIFYTTYLINALAYGCLIDVSVKFNVSYVIPFISMAAYTTLLIFVKNFNKQKLDTQNFTVCPIKKTNES